MSDIGIEAPSHEVLLTEVAAAKVKSLLAQEGRDDLRLRIAVQPGGCSGLIYQLYFDDRLLDGDARRDFEGVEVVVDRMSVPYLNGATIDFATGSGIGVLTPVKGPSPCPDDATYNHIHSALRSGNSI